MCPGHREDFGVLLHAGNSTNTIALGTLSLVWTTIFACTWTVLHLNVPGRNESAWRRGLRKTKWITINMLFFEFVFSKAVCDLRLALDELR
ncbi:hypothetical protein MFIFM68171_04212 [Madurella fahalii]|uniref:Uncharacterized protein n=1 Tax=Madurella fahalii TaxID=1157608 RepID=A0ABQ0G8B2_9PEZI